MTRDARHLYARAALGALVVIAVVAAIVGTILEVLIP